MSSERVELRGSDYQVRLALYEGSLRGLLDLMRRGEIAPEEVPLAQIGREYLAYLQGLAAPEPDREGEAVLTYALLMWTKLQSLLPGEPEPPDEELDEEEIRELLERHQSRYRQVQQASEWLAARAEAAKRSLPRPAGSPAEVPPEPPPEVLSQEPLDPQLLIEGLRRVLARLPREVEPPTRPIDWPAIVRRVRQRLATGRQVLFEELVAGASRREVIASFLALLELVRLGEARVWQEELFGPIYVTPCEVVVRP
ncbi:ScpA family protein [Limnochorda pilosa]|uniref:segregation and condensation protein A n=1 Tax=Limnochorda pilosa TaxID=1555112 RepID=UPI0026F199B2|nr:segregation/condensation protein A [Limnochorda pilosa]